MMYANKINIVRTKQIITFIEKLYMYDTLTINNLKNLFKEHKIKNDACFDVFQCDDVKSYYLIEVKQRRYETDAELKTRITKQELYNKNYEIFHAKYSKNNSK